MQRRGALSLSGGCLGALLLPPRALAAPRAATVREQLGNRLVVIVEERRTADVVALQLTARAGARDDAAEPGINALTSRMIFQGTGRRPSETELQRAAAQAGGTLGRNTSTELSWYSSVMPAGELELAFDLLADLVADPLLDAGALARQKQITLQDLNQRRTTPDVLLGDLFQETLFAGHPGSAPLLGIPESIEAATREALVANRERRWRAADLVLTVVGGMRVADAIAQAQRYFGALPAGERTIRPAVTLPALGPARSVFAPVGQQQVQLRLGFRAPTLLDDGRYAVNVLNAITGGASGRFFRELRTVRGLAYSAGSGYNALTDTAAWYAGAAVDPENVPAALALIREEIERLRAASPAAEEVARRISQIAGGQVLAAESSASRASTLASQEILGTPTTEEFVARIRSVTPEAVYGIAREYLDPDRAVVIAVGPASVQAHLPQPAPAAPVQAPPPVQPLVQMTTK